MKQKKEVEITRVLTPPAVSLVRLFSTFFFFKFLFSIFFSLIFPFHSAGFLFVNVLSSAAAANCSKKTTRALDRRNDRPWSMNLTRGSTDQREAGPYSLAKVWIRAPETREYTAQVLVARLGRGSLGINHKQRRSIEMREGESGG